MKRNPIDMSPEVPEPTPKACRDTARGLGDPRPSDPPRVVAHAERPEHDNDSIDESLERLAVRRRRVPASVESGIAYHAPARLLRSGNDTLPSDPPVILDARTDPPARQVEVTERTPEPTPQRALSTARARPLVLALVAGIAVVACIVAWRSMRRADSPSSVVASTSITTPAAPTVAPSPKARETASSEHAVAPPASLQSAAASPIPPTRLAPKPQPPAAPRAPEASARPGSAPPSTILDREL